MVNYVKHGTYWWERSLLSHKKNKTIQIEGSSVFNLPKMFEISAIGKIKFRPIEHFISAYYCHLIIVTIFHCDTKMTFFNFKIS